MRPDAHTLVAAYAVHALDEGERADVSEHLEQCDTCRDDLRSFRETATVLAAATAEALPDRVISLPRTWTSTSGCSFSTTRSSRSCGPRSWTMATPSA